MKTINNIYLEKYLINFLRQKINCGENGSFQEVLNWIDQNNKDIEDYRTSICSRFESLFPEAIVQLQSCQDDDCTFFIDIYGITPSREQLRISEDLSLSMETEELEDIYILIVRFRSLETTKKHYPKIHERLIEKSKK